jgi:biotin operon repressor
MEESVCALQTAEVVCGGSIGKAIGIARRDVEGIEDAQPIF